MCVLVLEGTIVKEENKVRATTHDPNAKQDHRNDRGLRMHRGPPTWHTELAATTLVILVEM